MLSKVCFADVRAGVSLSEDLCPFVYAGLRIFTISKSVSKYIDFNLEIMWASI